MGKQMPEWNRKGKRKKLYCYSVSDIAGARGVTNAAFHKAVQKGILHPDDFRSAAEWAMEDSMDTTEINVPQQKEISKPESKASAIPARNLSDIMQKTKAKKSKAEKKEAKLEIGTETIGYIKDNIECPETVWKPLRKLDIFEHEVPDERLCIGDINPQEMKFGDIEYEKKWMRIWAPLYEETVE